MSKKLAKHIVAKAKANPDKVTGSFKTGKYNHELSDKLVNVFMTTIPTPSVQEEIATLLGLAGRAIKLVPGFAWDDKAILKEVKVGYDESQDLSEAPSASSGIAGITPEDLDRMFGDDQYADNDDRFEDAAE